jgi:cytochrome c6
MQNGRSMKLLMASLIALLAAAIPAFADATPDGAVVYKSNCALCHGPDGKGQTSLGKTLKLRDLSSPEIQKQSDQELSDIVASGKGKMPAFKAKLSTDEITAVVGFIRALKK